MRILDSESPRYSVVVPNEVLFVDSLRKCLFKLTVLAGDGLNSANVEYSFLHELQMRSSVAARTQNVPVDHRGSIAPFQRNPGTALNVLPILSRSLLGVQYCQDTRKIR